MAASQTTATGLPYVGNPDFRGYLNYLAGSGDQTASTLLGNGTGGTGGIDNNGNINGTWLENAIQGANTKFGDEQAAKQNFTDYASNAYAAFNKLNSPGAGGAATSAGTNTNASDLAYLDDQDNSLRAQLQRANGALDQGLTQIGDSYNENVNRTNQDQTTADTGFNTQRTGTTKDKLGAIDTINTNARTLSDSVRRMLGQAGGTTSSAYKVAAPTLIARDTTTKRSGIQDTFANNYKNIDTSQTATDLKFSRALEDLLNQRKQKESDLRSGVLSNQSAIDAQLGQNALSRSQINNSGYDATRAAIAPYSDAVASRASAIDQLFSQFRTPYSLQDTTPVAANTDAYKTPTTNIGTSGNNPQANNDVTLSPYLLALQKKFQAGVA